MKDRTAVFTVLVIVGGIAVACAEPPQPQAGPVPRECFIAAQVSGFTEAPGSAILVSPSPSRTYELTLTGPACDDVAWAQAIAIDPSPSPQLCTGDQPSQGVVLFRDSASNRVVRCAIGAVRRVEDASGRANS